jgi:hypothetical protein
LGDIGDAAVVANAAELQCGLQVTWCQCDLGPLRRGHGSSGSAAHTGSQVFCLVEPLQIEGHSLRCPWHQEPVIVDLESAMSLGRRMWCQRTQLIGLD